MSYCHHGKSQPTEGRLIWISGALVGSCDGSDARLWRRDVMHRTHGCCAVLPRVVSRLRWVPCLTLDTGSGTHVTPRRAGGHENGGVLRFMAGCHV